MTGNAITLFLGTKTLLVYTIFLTILVGATLVRHITLRLFLTGHPVNKICKLIL